MKNLKLLKQVRNHKFKNVNIQNSLEWKDVKKKDFTPFYVFSLWTRNNFWVISTHFKSVKIIVLLEL